MFARAVRPGATSGAAWRWRRSSHPPALSTTSLTRPSLPTPARSFATSQPAPMCRSPALQHAEPPTARPSQDAEFIPNTPIRILRTAAEVHAWRRGLHLGPDNPGLALVPTMGALHAGHTTLIREAAARGHDKILVSIYVNPAQFGIAEDLDSYPKTWEADCTVLAALLPELPATTTELAVFAPPTPELYPSGPPGQLPDSPGSFVTITPAGALLEGKTRPTFFRGVATVCMKLFHIAQPAAAFFGQKDVQQTVVLRTMVRDFCMPLAVAVVPTVRDARDGLALSSRNVYLGARRRRVAPVLIAALRAAERVYLEDGGVTSAADIVPAALKVILDVLGEQMARSPGDSVLFRMDYVSLADPDTMEELDEVDPARGAILSGAIQMLPVVDVQDGEDLGLNGGPPVRLIDNIILPPRNRLRDA